MNEIMLSIVGTFIGLGLALNAYFIKGLLDKLNSIEISVAVMAKDVKVSEINNLTNTNSITDIYRRLWELNQRNK